MTFLQRIRHSLPPLLAYGLLWFIISDGHTGSWIVGLPAVVIAGLLHQRLQITNRGALNLREVFVFPAWFLWQSVRGGVDVASRTLRPRLRLQPGFVRYELRIPESPARTTLVNTLSLLPGTLSARIEGDVLLLHALDTQTSVVHETRLVEERIATLFGIRLA